MNYKKYKHFENSSENESVGKRERMEIPTTTPAYFYAVVPEIIVAKKPVVLSLFYSDIDGSSSVHKV